MPGHAGAASPMNHAAIPNHASRSSCFYFIVLPLPSLSLSYFLNSFKVFFSIFSPRQESCLPHLPFSFVYFFFACLHTLPLFLVCVSRSLLLFMLFLVSLFLLSHSSFLVLLRLTHLLLPTLHVWTIHFPLSFSNHVLLSHFNCTTFFSSTSAWLVLLLHLNSKPFRARRFEGLFGVRASAVQTLLSLSLFLFSVNELLSVARRFEGPFGFFCSAFVHRYLHKECTYTSVLSSCSKLIVRIPLISLRGRDKDMCSTLAHEETTPLQGDSSCSHPSTIDKAWQCPSSKTVLSAMLLASLCMSQVQGSKNTLVFLLWSLRGTIMYTPDSVYGNVKSTSRNLSAVMVISPTAAS
ncbi:hypothetical protein RchiOBHm_Chr7g0183631 [Rosa chinensis]|uniref:Uncharacterized protein n=1 Tax=Rosa chinensis TaxID=74649 RepID=A0A2P6P369_ROSCH|nr:hypothetical protein RchiOBHm_Chr7g0183631 [Rosa chinensis]